MLNTKISVCMATYNGEEYVWEQLQSILSQLSPNDEIIISDDGSTDKTLEIIKSIRDARIKIFHSSFRNVILNFENSLKQATGDIIFLSDQDDIWYPNKVAKSLEILEKNDLIFSNLSVFTNDINESYAMYDIKKDHNGLAYNFIKNHCVGATMAFRSTLLKYVLPIPKGIEMHDMWIYFIACFFGRTFYYSKPLIYYRRHGSNVSNTGEKTTNTIFKIAKIRLRWLVVIFKRIIKIIFKI